MTTIGQFLSSIGQSAFLEAETAPRPVVGFSMDYPAGLSTNWHSHSRAQLLYAVSGAMRIETEVVSYIIPPSMALFLPSNAEHAIRMDGPVAMRALVLREDAESRAATEPKAIAVSPLLREVILAACAEPLRWGLGGRGYFLTELALDEIANAGVMPLALAMPNDNRLRRAVTILLDRPRDAPTLEDLALAAGASSRTLARLFRSETGLSFRQWRQQARMTEAMAALSTGANPAQVAAKAGFGGQAAFGAAFRTHFGMTPGQARLLGKRA